MSSLDTTANRIETNISYHVRDLQERLSFIQLELENVKAIQIPGAAKLVETNEAAISEDFDHNMRQFLDHTDTKATVTPCPSMQVSSIRGSNSIMTSTVSYTARTHVTGLGGSAFDDSLCDVTASRSDRRPCHDIANASRGLTLQSDVPAQTNSWMICRLGFHKIRSRKNDVYPCTYLNFCSCSFDTFTLGLAL